MGDKGKKKHTMLKTAICIAAAAAAGAGGFYAGRASQTNSMMNALPRLAHDMQTEEDAERTEAAQTAVPNTETAEPGTYIGKSNISAAGEGTWSTVDSSNYDITGDGVNDMITLYTSAEADDKGILWDDTQNWILEVSDGESGYYTLLNMTLSNGAVYYEVSELSGGERSMIVYITSGAGTDITQYVFGRSGFEEKDIYSADGINRVHSSIPWYK